MLNYWTMNYWTTILIESIFNKIICTNMYLKFEFKKKRDGYNYKCMKYVWDIIDPFIKIKIKFIDYISKCILNQIIYIKTQNLNQKNKTFQKKKTSGETSTRKTPFLPRTNSAANLISYTRARKKG